MNLPVFKISKAIPRLLCYDNLQKPIVLIKFCLAFSVSRYSDVRVVAQGFLQRLLFKCVPEGHTTILDRLVDCLEDEQNLQSNDNQLANATNPRLSKSGNIEKLKGVLHILMEDKGVFFGSWKFMSRLLPSLIRAQWLVFSKAIIYFSLF